MSPQTLRQIPVADGRFIQSPDAGTFLKAFRHSLAPSIDAFLARRPEFEQVGKLAIAHQLLPKESIRLLLENDDTPSWYSLLLNSMDAPWDDLPRNQISFITFNYDRSLEMVLTIALANRHGKTQEEAMKLVKEHFPIVHVYGSLGSIDPQAKDFVPYGGGAMQYSELYNSTAGLKVMAEGRDDSAEFSMARKLLSEAEVLCFLGFAFDPTNVARLGGPAICAGGRPGPELLYKPFAATAFGTTAKERRRAARQITHPDLYARVEAAMLEMDCWTFLRETLMLR